MILQKSYPHDVRVRNEAISLLDAGHQVDLLCLASNGQGLNENIEGIHLYEVQIIKSKHLSRLNSLIFKVCFIDLLWLRAIYKYVNAFKPKILHVHDLPLTRTAWLVARKYGIPLIYDMHERYPDKVISWSKILMPSFLEIISTYSYCRQRALEKSSVNRCDKVICVSKFDSDIIISRTSINPNKITLVPNWVDTKIFCFSKQNRIYKDYNSDKNKWIILYVGTIWFHRGLDISIQAMPGIVKTIPNVCLIIGGMLSSETRRWLSIEIDKNGMSSYIKFTGWIDYSDIPAYLWQCQVVVLPFPSWIASSFSATHKIFQAMAMRRPIVATDVADYRENIEKIGCGLVVPPEDPQALAQAIIRLYQNPQLAEKLGMNGYCAVQERYNWKKAADGLLRLYSQLKTN